MAIYSSLDFVTCTNNAGTKTYAVPASSIEVAGIKPGTNGQVLKTTGGSVAWGAREGDAEFEALGRSLLASLIGG